MPSFPVLSAMSCSSQTGSEASDGDAIKTHLSRPAAALSASAALRADPLFLDSETVVVPVESVAALEEEGHGVVLERWGEAGGVAH